MLRAVGVEEVSLGAPLKSEDSKVDLHAKEEKVLEPEEEPKEEIEEVCDEEDDVEHITDDDVSSTRSSARSSSAHSSTRNVSEKHERPSTPAPVVHV